MKDRIVSCVVLIAIVILSLFISPVTRVLFFAVCGIMCCYELSRNFERMEIYCCAWVMYTYIAAQAVLTMFSAGLTAFIACCVAAVYLALFSGILNPKVSGKGALYTLAGVIYPGLLFALLMQISVCRIWMEVMIIACLATWTCDACALFGGKKWGKHKVAPHVSPNKTVEGCICGAVSSLAAGAVSWLILKSFNPYPLWVCLTASFIASSMGQIGDLSESLIKRMIGIKDFSDLIPGHGGMFDRADSLLFSIPTKPTIAQAFTCEE